MRKATLILLFILILSLNSKGVKAQDNDFQDLLIGIKPDSLYSHRLGDLVIAYGETVWFKISDRAQSLYFVELYYENGPLITRMPVISNNIYKLYTFDKEIGKYKLVIYNKFNKKITETTINCIKETLSLNELDYDYSNKNQTLSISLKAILPKENYFADGDFYIAILYPYSFTNYTKTLISAIAGEEAQREILRLGFSIIEQEVSDNKIIIKPLIYNQSLGFSKLSLDQISFQVYYPISFKKEINHTSFIINSPLYLNNTAINKFKINSQTLEINLDKKMRTTIINVLLNYYNNSPYIIYRYSTKILVKNATPYFILNINQMKNFINSSEIHITGEIDLNFMYFVSNNITNYLKDIYIAIIAEKEGLYETKIIKFKDKISFIKIFDNKNKEFLNNFQIIIKEGKAMTFNDTALLIYNNTPKQFTINITNALIPSILIYNNTIKDYEINIIQNIFYQLNITIIAEDLLLPNATLLIYYNKSLLIYNSTTLYGFVGLLLPKGIYEIFVKKDRYRDHNETVNLINDIILIIAIYKERPNENPEDLTATYAALSLILVIHALINIYLYRKTKRL